MLSLSSCLEIITEIPEEVMLRKALHSYGRVTAYRYDGKPRLDISAGGMKITYKNFIFSTISRDIKYIDKFSIRIKIFEDGLICD